MTGQGGGNADRRVAALAILKVNYDRGQSYLDNYLPYVYHCLCGLSDAEPISARELQRQILSDFGIDMPQGVVSTLLRRAKRDGKVRFERATYYPVATELEDANFATDMDLFSRRYQGLIASAVEFAKTEFGRDWRTETVDRLLGEYLDSFSTSVLRAGLGGGDLAGRPAENTQDEYVVHRWIDSLHAHGHPNFEFLVDVVKGRMLADAMYLSEDLETLPTLNGLEVYLDGPMLLWALGYAGPELEAPCRELVAMLRRQGANVRCFTHSAIEAQEILGAASAAVNTGQRQERFFGDVVTYLVTKGSTRSDIELYAERLPNNLLRLGIQTVETPARVERLEPDEARLQTTLDRRISYVNRRARDRDIDSLTAIHRLRGGRTAERLASATAIFVTRNYDLFRASAEFFDGRRTGRAVPHCVHDAGFTALVWLHEPRHTPDLPLERVLAAAHSALNPSDQLWRAFDDEIDRLAEREELDEEEVRFLRLADESRRALMDTTMGEMQAFTEGSVTQILEHSRALARRDVEAQLAAETSAHARTVQRTSDREKRVGEALDGLANRFATAAVVLAGALIALGIICGPVGPFDVLPLPVQLICAAAAIGATLWGFVGEARLPYLRQRLSEGCARRLRGRLGTWLDMDL